MTDVERAKQYIGIFLNAGDRGWEYYAPVDGVRTPRGIRIGTVEVWPHPDQPGVWRLDDGHDVRSYRAAVTR